jgi:hypothetical protein
MIKKVDMDSISGQMEANIKENFVAIKNMVMVFIHIQIMIH